MCGLRRFWITSGIRQMDVLCVLYNWLKHEQRDQHSKLVSMANKKDERMVRFMLDAIAAKDPFANTALAVCSTVSFVCSYSCIAGRIDG